MIVFILILEHLHGGLNTVTPKKDVHRYSLRMAKENSKIIYRGEWAREERAIMEDNGYKNGDNLDRYNVSYFI